MNISMPAVFGALALIAAGFLVYFLIDRKDKHEESDGPDEDDKSRGPVPAAPTPEQYKFPGEHPGRPGKKKPKDGPGPWRPK